MRSTPIMSPAVLAGTGPPGASTAVGAAPPSGRGDPAFQALLAMLLGTPATPVLVASSAPLPAEPAAPVPTTPERALAPDPIQTSLAGLAGLWFSAIPPAPTTPLQVSTGGGTTDAPRAPIPALAAGLTPTVAPSERGLVAAPLIAGPTSGQPPVVGQPSDPAALTAAPATSDPATQPTGSALAGPPVAPPPVARPSGTATVAEAVGQGASPRPERPVPPVTLGRRAAAPAAVESLVANQTTEVVEEAPFRPAQDEAAVVATPARPTPLAEGASAARPADDRRPTAPAESPFDDGAVDAIVRQARLLRAPGHTALRLHLRPADLGEVQVTIDVSARGATIHVASSNADGQAAIERGLPLLRGALESAGLDPDRLTLTTSGGSPSVTGGSAFDLSHQGRSRQDDAPARFGAVPGSPRADDVSDEPTTRSIVVARDGQLDIRA